jgi:hypothetical protein
MRTCPAVCLVLLVAGASVPGCGDDDPAGPGGDESVSPDQLMEDLSRALQTRDLELYATLLDTDFWFTETVCSGGVRMANGHDEELAIMGGSRDGSRPGILGVFRTFEYSFSLLSRTTEEGSAYPEASPGDPDGHPDEDWESYRGAVRMLLLYENGDGYRISQIMTLKLRLDGGGAARLVRWEADPLVGDCEAGKLATESSSWGQIKMRFR